ncbi:hypothetical protein [Legionella shakespearei]|uniref:Uncharacterized protein n=1 Tax=Legionella shakespearei DSM 23087 TaxID=1122169 RepID=A0A0W0Z8M7_9GAMM|nr:hypothetical protein [Legionella shakespearei]KTD65126.1 hypothetical protein Lsha_0495 [Legionella shakespearei DSM 23087]
MPANANFRSDFASLVQELHERPDDPRLKKDLVSRLPEMKARAQHDPMALYLAWRKFIRPHLLNSGQ